MALTPQELDEIKKSKILTTDQLTRLAQDRGDDIETTKSVMTGKGYTVKDPSKWSQAWESGRKAADFASSKEKERQQGARNLVRSIPHITDEMAGGVINKTTEVIDKGLNTLFNMGPKLSGGSNKYSPEQKQQMAQLDAKKANTPYAPKSSDYYKPYDPNQSSTKPFVDSVVGTAQAAYNLPGNIAKGTAVLADAIEGDNTELKQGMKDMVSQGFSYLSDMPNKTSDQIVQDLGTLWRENPDLVLGGIEGAGAIARATPGIVRGGIKTVKTANTLIKNPTAVVDEGLYKGAGRTDAQPSGVTTEVSARQVAGQYAKNKVRDVADAVSSDLTHIKENVVKPTFSYLSDVADDLSQGFSRVKGSVQGAAEGFASTPAGQTVKGAYDYASDRAGGWIGKSRKPQGEVVDVGGGSPEVVLTADMITKIDKGAANTIRGMKKGTDIQRFRKNVVTGMSTILDNKEAIQNGLFDENGAVAVNDEYGAEKLAEAASQTLNDMWNGEIQPMIDQATDAGGVVDTTTLAQKIDESLGQFFIKGSEVPLPGSEQAVNTLKKMRSYMVDVDGSPKALTLSDAQKISQFFNKMTKPLHEGMSAGDVLTQLAIEGLNNELRPLIDQGVESFLGKPGLSALKKRRGALRSIETPLTKRAQVANRQAAVGLFGGLGDLFTADGLASAGMNAVAGNPIGALMGLGKAVLGQVLKRYFKNKNNRNTMLIKVLQDIDKQRGGHRIPGGFGMRQTPPESGPMDQGTPQGPSPTTPPQAPAPEGIPIESFTNDGQIANEGVQYNQDTPLSPSPTIDATNNTQQSQNTPAGSENSSQATTQKTQSQEIQQGGANTRRQGFLGKPARKSESTNGQETITPRSTHGTSKPPVSEVKEAVHSNEPKDGSLVYDYDEAMMRESADTLEKSVGLLDDAIMESEYNYYESQGDGERFAEYYTLKNGLTDNTIGVPKKALASFDNYKDRYNAQATMIEKQANMDINVGSYEQSMAYKGIVKKALDLEDSVARGSRRDRDYDTMKENIIDDIIEAYPSMDQFEASDMYDTIINKESYDTLKTMTDDMKQARGKMLSLSTRTADDTTRNTGQISRDETNNEGTSPKGDSELVQSGKGNQSDTNIGERANATDDGTPARTGGSVSKQGGHVVTAKSKVNIKKQSEDILSSHNFSTNANDYTPEEIATLSQYGGAGGTKGLIGTKGVLDEFYTPQNVVQKMRGLAEKYAGSMDSILEPSVGTGNFIKNAPSSVKSIDAMEIDKTSGTIAQVLHPKADIKIMDFQDNFMDGRKLKVYDGKKYDVIIGNPPYKARNSKQRSLGDLQKVDRFEDYFIARGLDMLNEGGVMAYIVPSSFLKKGSSRAKDYIANRATLVDAYRLPEGAFGDTKVGTDIVIFKKDGGSSPATLANDSFMTTNPSKVLGETATRTDQRGKEVSYVKGDKNAIEAIGEKDIAPITKPINTMTIKEMDRKYGAMVADAFTAVENNSNLVIPEHEVIVPTKTDNQIKIEQVMEKKGFLGKKRAVKGKVSPQYPTDTHTAVFGANYTNADKLLAYKSKQTVLGDIEGVAYTADPALLNYHKGKTYTNDIYFSGNIYEKLDDLASDSLNMSKSQYEKQYNGLIEVLPRQKAINEIVFNPIDSKIMDMETGVTKMQYGREVPETISMLFKEYLRGTPIVDGVGSYDITKYIDGKKLEKDKKGIIKDRANELFNKFMSDSLDREVQEMIVDQYNKKMNAYVRPDYASAPIVVNDISPNFNGKKLELRDPQIEGVNFLVNKGVGLLAYGVGVGKTLTGLIATVVNMQKGWTKKPLFVVPKATLNKTWIKTIKQTFPTVSIVDMGGLTVKDVARLVKERGSDVSQWIKEGEIAVVTHDAVNTAITFKPETEGELMRDLQDSMATKSEDKSARKMANEKEKIEGELGKGLKVKSEIEIYVEDLGIDHITVDEVHNFKNIFSKAELPKDMEGVRPMNRYGDITGSSSMRGRKMRLLSQYILNRNQGRNVFLLSATPFNNQAIEVYNILSLMGRERMKKMGINNINDFYTQFAHFHQDIIPGNDSLSYVEKTVMKSFANTESMQKLLTEFVDYKSGEDANVQRPDLVMVKPVVSMTDLQKEKQAEIVRKINDASTEDKGAVLVGMGKARANALSPYAMDIYSKPTPSELVKSSGKLQLTTEYIKESIQRGDGAVVFWDLGVHLQPIYKQYLMDIMGLKESDIGIIDGSTTLPKRDAITEGFNDGSVKVLIGGKPIHEGIDLQTNGYTMVDLTLDWNPTPTIQKSGRVWRQGNKRDHVQYIIPLMENSSDIGMMQKFEEKSSRINDIFSYQGSVFNVEDVDPTEMKIALLTDPHAKAGLEIQLETKRMRKEMDVLNSDMHFYQDMKEKMQDIPVRVNDLVNSINNMEDSIKRYLPEGKKYEDALNESRQKPQITKYKKEVASLERKLKGLKEKLADRGIGEDGLDAVIADIENKIKDKEETIKTIADSKQERVEKFTQIQADYERSRKTMEQHVKDYKSKYDTLKRDHRGQ